MSDAPRVTNRSFPDAAQVGVVSGTVITESEITFSGARGLVIVLYDVLYANGGAVAINNVGVAAAGTAVPNVFRAAQGWFDATAGRILSLICFGMFVDPPDGSTFRLTVNLSGGSVDVNANQSALMAMSFEPGVETGPVVTVS